MKKFHNFADFCCFMGVQEEIERTPIKMKCKMCGAEMRHIDGTNIYICACGHRVIKGVRTDI